MAGVYEIQGFPARSVGRTIGGAISTYRAKKAAEEEAARKAAEKAEKARKAAEAKAIKEKAKAEKLRKANLKEFGPHTDQELSDLGYSSKGHYRTAADEWGQLSTGDQKGYTDKQMEAELKRDAKAGGKGGKSKKGPNYRTKAEQKAARKLAYGPQDVEDMISQDAQNEAIARALAKKKSIQDIADKNAEATAESARIRLTEQAGVVGDYPVDTLQINKERKEIAVLAKKIEKARIEADTKKAKEDAAWWAKQRALEAAETKTAMTRLGAGNITKEFGGPGNIEWSDKRRAELFNLTDAQAKIRGEAIDAGTVPSGGWPLPQYLASQVGFPPKQGLTLDRIKAIETDFEAYEKDVVTQSIMDIARQQALHKGGEATTRSEFIRIQGLIADGKLTIVQITDNADGTMDASPVSEDGLREQLRATDPTYIDAGPNPVVRIDGVLYEKFGDQFFPLEEMAIDDGMEIGGLPSGMTPFVPTPYEHPASRQFLPGDGMGLNPARTLGSFPPINLRRRSR